MRLTINQSKLTSLMTKAAHRAGNKGDISWEASERQEKITINVAFKEGASENMSVLSCLRSRCQTLHFRNPAKWINDSLLISPPRQLHPARLEMS